MNRFQSEYNEKTEATIQMERLSFFLMKKCSSGRFLLKTIFNNLMKPKL